ncbi:glutamine synthetase family protein [Permianibacter aggregans]|uniref:L-glutamine synthetase n=1 Tax=Permianibacter aggregans TaxID=1510150 RepID=A0A4R6UGZ0_9GAMM|nr:glutamine synthetase family protein [Permianibacter aggregans]QGX39288.1 glutamine synthetase [Permianibacter aggregans]TDQ42414.1 L-glutamine synthetase [Permianibacter aggregans]
MSLDAIHLTPPTIHNNAELIDWLRELRIDEVECLVPDINGVMRGKIVPRGEFIESLDGDGLRLPEHALIQGVTGDSDSHSKVAAGVDLDIYMVPDPATVRIVPWYEVPTAQIICDAFNKQRELVPFAPRSVLKRILANYSERNWKPVVAPELEFYLVEKNTDPDLPLNVPTGLSGRKEAGRQAYGIEASNEYDPVVNLIYDYCDACGINIGTVAHEAGPAQLEINFKHGDPLAIADQVFMFKRVVRKAAQKYDMYATFMAQPHESEPGSAMHIHQSIVDKQRGINIFANDSGDDTELLMHYIAGLQHYVEHATALFCPNVNSFRRMRLESDAPINLHWGRDNRTCGLRVPDSSRHARRVENRIGGADSNPYIAFAATLACGLIGLTEQRQPGPMTTGDAHELAFTLPRHLTEALSKLDACLPLRSMLSDRFVDAFIEVKNLEMNTYNRVVSSWERNYLLLSI